MWFVAILCLVVACPTLSSAGEVPYSAIVLDVTGKVTVLHGSEKRALNLGDMLYPGDVVETAKDASVRINYLESGQEEQCPGGLKFTIDKTKSNPVHPQVKTSIRKTRLPDEKSGATGGTIILRESK